jgi:hypothetical protein
MSKALKDGEFRVESYKLFNATTGKREIDNYLWKDYQRSDQNSDFIDAVVEKIDELGKVWIYWGLEGHARSGPRIQASKWNIKIFGDPVFNMSRLEIDPKSHFDIIAKSLVEKLKEKVE